MTTATQTETAYRPASLQAPDGTLRNRPAGRIIPRTNWPEYHDWPNRAQWAWMFHQNRHTKAFQRIYRKVNGRILIIEDAFFAWCGIDPAKDYAHPGAAARKD